jgi:hypothetical protein
MRANARHPGKHPVGGSHRFLIRGDPSPSYQVIETRSDGSGTQYLAESDVIISGGQGDEKR